MNRLLLILLVFVFMAVGSLFFFSSDEAPVEQAQQTDNKATQKKDTPALTEAERDTYANTIKTMNARNNKLMLRLDEMEKRLQEKDKQALKSQDVERIVNRSVEDRAKSLTSTFTEKVKQIQGKLDDRRGKIRQGGDLPSGLGFDDLGGIGVPGFKGKSGRLTIEPKEDIVTILPVTLIGTMVSATGDKADIPLAIDGAPLDTGMTALDLRGVPSKEKKAEKPQPIPFYTIPQNATLFSNDTLTALVGIVPNLQGSVIDPIRFKIITGNTNLATNGLTIPGVKNIVWSGIAIGNREMSCVRGELHSVTFTFEDGRIRTLNSQTDKGKSRLGGSLLGYISTPQGNPCLPGKLITNAQDYLTDRMLASGVAAAAEGFAQTQQTTRSSNDGTITQFFDGNSGEYVASKTLSGSLGELTEYLRERQRQAVDLVFLEAGQKVVLHVETELPIDYDPEGRKLDHASDLSSKRVSYHLD